VWHDRAVYHFLVDRAQQARYRDRLKRLLEPGGLAIIATFSPDGPAMCSGLPGRPIHLRVSSARSSN
jgi:hypothetical protein